jgi:hypothetical protein
VQRHGPLDAPQGEGQLVAIDGLTRLLEKGCGRLAILAPLRIEALLLLRLLLLCPKLCSLLSSLRRRVGAAAGAAGENGRDYAWLPPLPLLLLRRRRRRRRRLLCLQTLLQGLAVRWLVRRKVNCAPKMSDGQLKLATRRELHTALVVGDRLLP